MNDIMTQQDNNQAMQVQQGQTFDATQLIFDPDKFQMLEKMGDIMASGRSTIPAHLAGNKGDCTAVIMQAMMWGMNPYAVAQKTHLINGTLGYEGQLVNAVLTRSGAIVGRPEFEFFGDWNKVVGKFVERKNAKGNTYRAIGWTLKDEEGLGVIVRCTLTGEVEPREYTLLMKQAGVRNSTEWANDPQQQITYLAIRKFVRRYCPDVLLGVYTNDELHDDGFDNDRDITPPPGQHYSQNSARTDREAEKPTNAKLQAVLDAINSAKTFEELDAAKIKAASTLSGNDRKAAARAYKEKKPLLAIDAEATEVEQADKPEEEKTGETYAVIMSNIQAAETADDIDHEVSLAGHLPEDQIKELATAAEKKKASLK